MIRWFVLLGLIFAPQVAHAEWYEASTPHFIVYANDTTEHVQNYATKLERFDRALRVMWGMPNRTIAPAERVTVYVVPDQGDVESLYGGEGVAGFYHGSIEGPVAFVPHKSGYGERDDLDPDAVLRHEYAHHFMYDNFDNLALPLWFSEGFAEFHATAVMQDDGAVVFGKAPLYRARAILEDGIPIAQVLTADKRAMTPNELVSLYGMGWLLIHYMTFEPSRSGQLKAYLAALNSGESAADAAVAFGDLRQLNLALIAYAKRRTLTSVTVAANALTLAPATLRRLTPGEIAMMPIRIRSKAGVTDKTAPGVFARARSIAATYPGDPGVQLVLAEAACDAHEYAECLAAANRAIATDPHSGKAFIFQGRALMAAAAKAPTHDVEAFHNARKSFIAANRLDPDDPEALTYYYRSFTAAGEQASANARAALLKALDFAPEDQGLRFEVALADIAAGDRPQARATLLPLAYSPHGGEVGKRAAALVAAIDKGDSAAIEAILHPPASDAGKDKRAK